MVCYVAKGDDTVTDTQRHGASVTKSKICAIGLWPISEQMKEKLLGIAKKAI